MTGPESEYESTGNAYLDIAAEELLSEVKTINTASDLFQPTGEYQVLSLRTLVEERLGSVVVNDYERGELPKEEQPEICVVNRLSLVKGESAFQMDEGQVCLVDKIYEGTMEREGEKAIEIIRDDEWYIPPGRRIYLRATGLVLLDFVFSKDLIDKFVGKMNYLKFNP